MKLGMKENKQTKLKRKKTNCKTSKVGRKEKQIKLDSNYKQ